MIKKTEKPKNKTKMKMRIQMSIMKPTNNVPQLDQLLHRFLSLPLANPTHSILIAFRENHLTFLSIAFIIDACVGNHSTTYIFFSYYVQHKHHISNGPTQPITMLKLNLNEKKTK